MADTSVAGLEQLMGLRFTIKCDIAPKEPEHPADWLVYWRGHRTCNQQAAVCDKHREAAEHGAQEWAAKVLTGDEVCIDCKQHVDPTEWEWVRI